MLFFAASTVILALTVALFFVLQTPFVFFFGALALWFVVDLKVFSKAGNMNSEGAGYLFFSAAGIVPTFFLEGDWLLAYFVSFIVLHFVKMIFWLKFFDKTIGELFRDWSFYLGIVLVIGAYVTLPFFLADNEWIATLIFAIALPCYIITSAFVAHCGKTQLYYGDDDSELLFGGIAFWGVNFVKYLGLAIASPFILLFKLFKLLWEGLGISELREELGIWFWILFGVIILFAILALTGLIVKMADKSTEIFGWLSDILNNLGAFPCMHWYMSFVETLSGSLLIVLLAVFVLAGFVIIFVADIVWLLLCLVFTIVAFVVCGLVIFVFYTVLPGAAGIACLVLLIIAFANCDKEREDVTLFIVLLLLIIAAVAAYYIPVIPAL